MARRANRFALAGGLLVFLGTLGRSLVAYFGDAFDRAALANSWPTEFGHAIGLGLGWWAIVFVLALPVIATVDAIRSKSKSREVEQNPRGGAVTQNTESELLARPGLTQPSRKLGIMSGRPSALAAAWTAAKVGVTLALFFAGITWRIAVREHDPVFRGPLAYLVVLSIAAFAAVVVFVSRWSGVYRTSAEWNEIKAAGVYDRAEESRRAGLTLLIGGGSVLGILVLLWMADQLSG
jgi:hypothetical protein